MGRPVVGEKLAGRYEIRALATGSSGYLFRGFDEQIGVEVALRIIDDHLLTNEAERHAFVAAATRAKSLQHPNLVRLYDILVDDSSVFLVMQWAPGERLAQRLAAGVVPDAAQARIVLRRVAAGIAHAHQHGVVTGNLRADTIILYDDGLKVTNVGIGPSLPRDRYLSEMSARGALLDLAPELRAGAALDARADVFALSRLALRLLGPTGVPEEARAVLERGLAEDPALRPRDIEAFVRELEAALDGRLADRPPAIPTGFDTERMERLPPFSIEGDNPIRPDVLAMDRRQERTVGSKGSRVLELGVEDLVEVGNGSADGMTRPLPKAEASPEVTDVGRRTPVRVGDDVPQQSAQPEVFDDEATREHERLEPARAIEIPTGEAERIPTIELSPDPQPFAWMPLVLAAALVLGGVVAVAGIQAAGHHQQPPIAVEVRSSSPGITITRIPQPMLVVTPVATAPIAQPVVTAVLPATTPLWPAPAASGTCPLGMAELQGAHPYCIDLYEYPGGHTIPRTQVGWHDAGAICQGRGLRLCTDVEWEQACRGPSQASFPYGSSYDPARCNTGGKALTGAILPAGELVRCRSASGAYDMSGNVAEWTQSGAQRGGSVLLAPPNGRCSHAVHMADPRGAADVGFRCCGDASPPER